MPAFTVNLSHDVDRVRKTYQYATDLRRGQFAQLKGLVQRRDPFWAFDDITAVEDRYGVRSTFFFLEETISPTWTSPYSWMLAFGRYSFDDPAMVEVIRRLDAEGWEVGLHGSYNSYRDLGLLRREKARLEEVLGHSVVGGRQHYLNLDVPETWQLHRAVGLAYDASFGHKRGVGWREGRYHPFRDEASGVVVLPLAAMETNLFAAAETWEGRWQRTLALIDEAEREGALLSVLWHQRMLNPAEFPGYAALYERLIQECQARGAEFLTCQEIYQRSTERVSA